MKSLNVRIGIALLVAWTIGLEARAADAKLTQATELYKERANPAKVTEALELLKQAETEATDDEVKYEVLVLASKLLYFQGTTHAAGDNAKMQIHDQGRAKAEAARKLLPDYAEAYFWSAANLGRWAEAKGVLASLSKKQEIMDTLEAIFERTTKEGDLGEEYEGYGADRILGRLYFKLPGFAGGSQATSVKHLERAYKNAKNVALNVVFYAETLYAGNATQKALAKRILDELLAEDPNTYNPDRLPETLVEFKDARKLRSEMGP